MNEEQKEAHREKSKWAGYVPPEKRRPTDEFFDLNTLATDCVRVEIVGTDYSVVKRVQYKDFISQKVDKDAILKFVLIEGSGTLAQNTDEVYFRHETRHDNGQLVDFCEKRKVDEKFDMKGAFFQEHYKMVLRTMRKGEHAYVRFSPIYHKMQYHKAIHYQNKTQEEKDGISEYIFVRFQVNKIRRNPQCTNPELFTGIMAYYEKIREVCRELMEEKEYNNASDLYKRILPQFKNMPKIMRDGLNAE